MARIYWVLTGIVCAIFIHESSGLRCYECMNCNDQFNASDAKVKVETCSGRCAKTKRDNSGYVVRFCTPNYPGDACTWTKSTRGDHDIGFCACETDLCNSATLLRYQMNFLVCMCFSFVVFMFNC